MPEVVTIQSSEEYRAAGGMACPRCGAEQASLDYGPTGLDGEQMYQRVECVECGASWFDQYQLMGYAELQFPLRMFGDG